MTVPAGGIVLVSTGCDLGPLAGALRRSGADVTQATYADDCVDISRPIGQGGHRTLVFAHMPELLAPTPFAQLDDAGWIAQCEAPLRRAVRTLVGARKAMQDTGQGGAIVGLGPALSLVGGPRVAALATAMEGQRGFMKAAARQSLTRGIAINWIAVHPAFLTPELADIPNLTRFEVGGYGRNVVDADALAPLVLALAGGAGRAMAGQTLVADGGDWMTP